MLYQKVTSGDIRICFTDIAFLDSHSPYFLIKNGLQLLKEKALKMLPKYGKTETQNWLQGGEKKSNV